MAQYKIFILLSLLYYLQAIPYGIQVKVLPIYLYDILGYPIGLVTKISLLMSPWIFFKPIAAYGIKSHRASLIAIVTSLLFMGLLHFLLFSIAPASGTDPNLSSIAVIFLFVNCFTVLLDAATDRLAMSAACSFKDLKFLGISNSIQIICYKCGATFGGIVLYTLGYSHIHSLFMLVTVICFASVVVVLTIFPEKSVSRGSPHMSKISTKWFSDVLEMISVNYTLPLIAYVLLYKLGEMGAMTIHPMLLMQNGVPRDTVSLLSSLISISTSLVGSLVGGLICSIHKTTDPIITLLKMLLVFSLMRCLPLCLQFNNITSFYATFLFYCLLPLLGGIVSTLTFTLMMTVSCQVNDRLKAIHYAIISAIEVTGKLIFSSYSGYLNDNFGNTQLYLFFILLTIVAVIPLYQMYRQWCKHVKLE
ncbi:major facilitator superfamily domain-containing protein 3-like [Clavelina lepadiformis]|uniref:major facilitator superfamily domain-containing protein 3-like n=1 Tax=Clavelina lepadiformis TaxID=159417 RepID=UPI004042526E